MLLSNGCVAHRKAEMTGIRLQKEVRGEREASFRAGPEKWRAACWKDASSLSSIAFPSSCDTSNCRRGCFRGDTPSASREGSCRGPVSQSRITAGPTRPKRPTLFLSAVWNVAAVLSVLTNGSIPPFVVHPTDQTTVVFFLSFLALSLSAVIFSSRPPSHTYYVVAPRYGSSAPSLPHRAPSNASSGLFGHMAGTPACFLPAIGRRLALLDSEPIAPLFAKDAPCSYLHFPPPPPTVSSLSPG